MGDYLPPVVAELTANISQFAAMMAAAKAIMDSLAHPIEITANTGPATAALAILSRQMNETRQAAEEFIIVEAFLAQADDAVARSKYEGAAAFAVYIIGLRAAMEAAAQLALTEGVLIRAQAELSSVSYQTAIAASAERLALTSAADAAKELAIDKTGATAANKLLAASANDSSNALLKEAAAGGAAGAGMRLFGTGLRITGNTIHWIIAVSAEFLAVFIPAMVALGAAMVVASQGVMNVYTHMSALYTATEATSNMFHQTIGTALGLGDALQRAQNAANPVVYSILGGAVMALHGQMGNLANTGLEVMRVFQNFSAHIVADFQQGLGTQVTGILHNMIADLVTFGQILGNIGHAVLNFAAAMPGLAEVLLSIVNSISQFILWVSKVPPILITVVMAMEEFWRWGGAVAGLLTRLPALITGFIGAGFGLVPVFMRVASIMQAVLLIIPRLVTGLGVLMTEMTVMPAAFQRAGAAMAAFGTEAQLAIGELGPLELIITGLALGAMGLMIYKLATATTNAERLTAAMQQTVNVARGASVFADIAHNLTALSADYTQATLQAHYFSQEVATGTGVANRAYVGMAATARQTASTLHAGMTQQEHDLLNATQAVTYLSEAYGVNFVGALALGTAAGVRWDAGIGHMSVAADINLIKVQQLMQGYRLMGQTTGAVGKDMEVIGIEAALSASKIGQLTQAWQQFMQQVTGGTNALATFEQGLQNMGTVASSTAGTLFAATGNMTQSTNTFAQSLTKFTGNSAQDWQNFDQVVSTGAENFISWMQTAGAMGAVKGAQMTGAIQGIVKQLIPFATHSQAARVALAALDAQTGKTVAPTTKALEAFNKGGMSAKQLAQFVNEATAKLGDMAAVAQQLGAVMQNDLVDMFDKAKIAASGLPADLSNLANGIASNNTPASVLHDEMMKVLNDLGSMHVSVPTITALLNTMGITISQSGVKALMASGQMNTFHGSLSTLNGQVAADTKGVQGLAAEINALHNKTIFITTYYKSVGIGNRGGHTGTGPGGPPYASGTPVASPGVHLVGEQGPEMIMFGGGERVFNAQDTAAMLKPSPSQVTVHERQPIMVALDGDTIYKGTRQSTLEYDIQNNTRGRYGGASGKMARG